MNWIAEQLAFERWLETNPLPALAQLLWYKLMAQNNKSLWSEWFAVDNLRLMLMLGSCSEKTAMTARNQLIDAGRVEYRKGKKGCPNKYRMIPFDCKISSQNGSINGGIIPVKTEVQTADIYKLKQETINDSCFGDDLKNSELARASAGAVESGGNCGKPDEAMSEAAQIADRLFSHYFDRPPTEHDVELLFEQIRRGERQPDDSFVQHIDPDRVGVAEYAFQVASEAGIFNWSYLRGVFAELAGRGLKTREDCEIYDAQRDFEKDNRR